tara:strand:- start:660 stop:938 length:279 start_codon:yes stop_codon:yes gene_type:complete
MNSPDSLNVKPKNLINLITTNWENLDESQKSPLIKIWQVLTYKWQLQILLNAPFLIYWLLDKQINSFHQFNLEIISKLNLPEWLVSIIGFNN